MIAVTLSTSPSRSSPEAWLPVAWRQCVVRVEIGLACHSSLERAPGIEHVASGAKFEPVSDRRILPFALPEVTGPAGLMIGLGPGICAGVDAAAVVTGHGGVLPSAAGRQARISRFRCVSDRAFVLLRIGKREGGCPGGVSRDSRRASRPAGPRGGAPGRVPPDGEEARPWLAGRVRNVWPP